jgi:hypothetical protein
MASITNGFITLNPNFMMPEIIMQYQQPSGAFLALPNSTISPRLSPTDLAVYIKRLNVKSAFQANQNIAQQLPSCSIDADMISAPTYYLRARAIYDHHDIATQMSGAFHFLKRSVKQCVRVFSRVFVRVCCMVSTARTQAKVF